MPRHRHAPTKIHFSPSGILVWLLIVAAPLVMFYLAITRKS
jgi:hypothetical protein